MASETTTALTGPVEISALKVSFRDGSIINFIAPKTPDWFYFNTNEHFRANVALTSFQIFKLGYWMDYGWITSAEEIPLDLAPLDGLEQRLTDIEDRLDALQKGGDEEPPK